MPVLKKRLSDWINNNKLSTRDSAYYFLRLAKIYPTNLTCSSKQIKLY